MQVEWDEEKNVANKKIMESVLKLLSMFLPTPTDSKDMTDQKTTILKKKDIRLWES